MILGELAARVSGAGPPVVLLHGNSEDSAVFDQMLAHLEGFTTIRLDSRGHGGTAAGRRPLTIQQLAIDTARAMLDYRRRWSGASRTAWSGPGPVRFGLIGFSDGANIGLDVAIHRPDLLAAQVLLGGNVNQAALRAGTNALIMAGHQAMRLGGLVSPAARRRADVWGLMVGQPDVSRAQLESLTVPTLIMVGERDVVPRRESRRVARLIPDSEWVELAGHGHMLPRTAPKLVAELAGAYLAPRLRGE
ncbi:MAG: alpha/beta hydrolase [Bifidobacteriaceae bacterium]|nr:alpha/beta hydrolase [Bifidobacteriaceae bacterium]